MTNLEKIEAGEMLPECPLQNVRNSLMEKTGQNKKFIRVLSFFFFTESRRKQYMDLPCLWLQSLCETRVISFCGSLTQATDVSWRSMYHLIGRGFSALQDFIC